MATQYNKSCALSYIVRYAFDSPKLTWHSHIDYLQHDCNRRLDILKTLASTTWGASRKMLRIFYVAYIRSKIEYGCEVYSVASSMEFDKINKIQNAALRIILGARKTTPLISLETECHLPPLRLLCNYRSAKFYIKLISRSTDDATSKMLSVESYTKDNRCNNSLHVFRGRIEHILQEFKMDNFKQINGNRMTVLPPHYDIEQHIITDLGITDGKELTEMYKQYLQIFTDGSKVQQPETSTSLGIYIKQNQIAKCWKIRAEHSVVAAELFAIMQALLYIKEHPPSSSLAIVFTDSMASCNIIKAYNCSYDITSNHIKELLYELNKRFSVKLHWVKAHCGIYGNEVADRTAKLGHKNNKTELYPLEQEEIQTLIQHCFLTHWNSYRKNEVLRSHKGTHLWNIQSEIKYNNFVFMKNRRHEVTLARLRLGHAATKSYLYRFKLSDSNECDNCGAEETIEHVLTECPQYQHQRNKLITEIREYNLPNLSVRSLLGGEGKVEDKRYIIKATIDYIRRIGKIEAL